MIPNALKSTVIMTGCTYQEQGTAMELFAYVQIDISAGLKYLGYHIKQNDYKVNDWRWLIAKVERRINTWYNRWLSRVGHLVLIKSGA